MISIRKFVGYAGAAAGICGVLVLATSTTAGFAAAPSMRPIDGVVVTHDTVIPPTAVSAACAAALQSLKTWAAGDRTEDASERSLAMTDADAVDQSEDATERATKQGLFASIHNACAPARTASVAPGKFAPSAACTSAISAVKAAWQQGRPSTAAQWQQLFTLMKAVRSACGGMFIDRDGDAR